MQTETTTFITAGDLHLRVAKPRVRTDDIVITEFLKLNFMLKKCKRYKAQLILAGDIFDTPFVPYHLVRKTIQTFQKYGVQTYAVFGQHDLRYHSLKQIDNTPLAVLLAAINGVLLNDQGVVLNDNILIKGMSWGEEYPQPDSNYFNILVAHLTVNNDEPLFPGDTISIEANKLLDKSGFDLIITGDNHQSFMVERNGKLLVNNGSMLRLNITQKEFQPRFSKINIANGSISDFEWLKFPVQSSVEIFKESVLDGMKKQSGSIDKYLDVLQNQDKAERPDFILKLKDTIKSIDDEKLKFWLDKILETYTEEVQGVN